MKNLWFFVVTILILHVKLVKTQEKWKVVFPVEKVEMNMDSVKSVKLNITDIRLGKNKPYKFLVRSANTRLATIDKVIDYTDIDKIKGSWIGSFNISAEFLGETEVYVELQENDNTERSKDEMKLVIVRKLRVIDHIFTGSVALLVSLLYINFGAALDIKSVKSILTRPVGPAIGFVGQFIIMPVTSYVLGHFLFKDSVAMQLGLFFTGVSPGGGASNIWAVILQGNINLSIAMTTISNFAAFGMMPLWLFTLGKVIFDRGNYVVPYTQIATFAFGLIIPLGIGIAIQRFLPRVAKILVRMLKPVSVILILFIIIFAIVTNLYLFELFQWQIVVAGLGLPWIGYTLSWILAKLFKQPPADVITIAIETGIQNTGIAIFLLRFTLEPPNGDLTTVVPVAVAIMTPIPLLFLYLWQKLRRNNHEKRKYKGRHSYRC